ncbi:MAG: hypothetical protein WCG26_15870, partial [Chloroflexales bacterium]
TNVSRDEQTGDTKYLDTAMKAMDKIAQLLRFSTALQVEVSVTHQGPDGGPIQVTHDLNYAELEGEKLTAYMRQLAEASLLLTTPLINPAQITAGPSIIEGETVPTMPTEAAQTELRP